MKILTYLNKILNRIIYVHISNSNSNRYAEWSLHSSQYAFHEMLGTYTQTKNIMCVIPKKY